MGRENRFWATHLLTVTAISPLLAMFLEIVFGIESSKKYQQITIYIAHLVVKDLGR